MKGTYVLYISLKKSTSIMVGKKEMHFEPGVYYYVGSAQNNLEKRVNRHMVNTNKNKHWHIDYLCVPARVESANLIVNASRKTECILARELSKSCKSTKGFGSSDCSCDSHLFISPETDIDRAIDFVVKILLSMKMKYNVMIIDSKSRTKKHLETFER